MSTIAAHILTTQNKTSCTLLSRRNSTENCCVKTGHMYHSWV